MSVCRGFLKMIYGLNQQRSNKVPKLIAETVDQEENVWKIYDNFTLENIYYGSVRKETYGPVFMSYLKMLKPGNKYRFMTWKSDSRDFSFEKCFRPIPLEQERIPHYYVVINVFGFDPIKCKECGSEIKASVCPNRGEWN